MRRSFFQYRVALVLLLFVTILASGRAIIGHFWSNIGSVHLQAARSSVSEAARESLFKKAEQFYLISLGWEKINSTVLRGIGFIYWNREYDQEAFSKWQQLGLNDDHYIAYGRLARSEAESLRWYKLAEQVTPTSTKLWLDVGKICQQKPIISDICDRFFTHNNNNWIVDPSFAFGKDAWRFNRRDLVDYAIVECPDLPQQKCATVKTLYETPQQSISWHQCLYLEPNQAYHYAAWIKVDIDNDGNWRPLYFQGTINGENRGSWPGNQMAATSWQYWERTFVAPDFEAKRACFHPVVLFGTGQTWFYGASLSPHIDE